MNTFLILYDFRGHARISEESAKAEELLNWLLSIGAKNFDIIQTPLDIDTYFLLFTQRY